MCAASVCSWRPSSTADPSREVAAAALDAGLVVNAVTESALRLAPPLLVTDDEIDEAVAMLAKVLAMSDTCSRSTICRRRS